MDAESNDQMQVQEELVDFGQKQREAIWKHFLKKNMDSLKLAITKNVQLN